jgi:prolyl-tRNA editing enzyme YbaK/EbsC (Cys-tRNA(Pro) deacylase)
MLTPHEPPPASSAPTAAPVAPPAAAAPDAPDLRDHTGVQRVLAALAVHHVHPQVVTLPDAVRTAAAAAAALGITPAEIANSLVFRATCASGGVSPVLILTSGAHKVDLVKVADLVDDVEHLERADAEFVRDTTGFAIGGVAPVGHTRPVPTYVDVSLSRHPYVWAAAGHSHTVFRTTYEELLRVTSGRAIEVA